jgi:hypothetical protein
MKKIMIAAGLIAGVASFGASAQTFTPKFYAGAEVGYSAVDDNAQTLANTLVATNGGSASVTQNTGIATGRIFGGYKVIEYVDVELGIFRGGNVNYNFSGVSRGATPYSGTASIYTQGIDYSVLLRPSLSSGFNNLFVRLGGAWSQENLSVSGNNIVGGSSSVSGNGYIYGLGYDVPVDKTIDARISINRLQNIAGQSSDNATVYSVGILAKF